MWKSLKEYSAALGYWGLIVIAPVILDIIGVYQLAIGSQFTGIPSWIWFQIAFVFLLLIPFIAFHKVRIRVDNLTEDRRRELARLILQVRDAAGKVVLHHMAIGLTDEVKQLHVKCNEILTLLNREGEVDGGEIKEIIYNFTTFVGTHVTRLLGGFVLRGDNKMMEQMDEYRFCGHMANHADEAMRSIRKAFRK
jgi:hypothetical protein